MGVAEKQYSTYWALSSIAMLLYAESVIKGYYELIGRRRLGIVSPQMPPRTPLLSIAHLPEDAYQCALWSGPCSGRPGLTMSYAECLAGVGGFHSELCGRV